MVDYSYPALPAAGLSAAPSSEGRPARGRRVLLVDLNNFANFPTLAIGLLVAALRDAGHAVRVVCPLAHGVPAAERERRETRRDDIARRLNLSTREPYVTLRDAARAARGWWSNLPSGTVLRATDAAMRNDTDIVLLSAYLQHLPTIRRIGALARRRGIPLLIGGPMFNIRSTAEAWRDVPGLTALYGGEAEREVAAIVDAICQGEDLMRFPGIVLPDGRHAGQKAPLRGLDTTPVPDFTDFPWEHYPVRIIPMMTGRGCQWSKCVFCSDVVSASGRTFRTRGVETVLNEMRDQARMHHTNNFLFLDLKLNSSPPMLRGIADGIQAQVPGAQWIGTVHVDRRADNGLSRRDLKTYVAAGMRRVSFGLETGSQRLLDAMKKGSSIDACSDFIRHAHEAGLSVRCTMMLGFPGETAADLLETAAFLERHGPWLDRVRLNAFSVISDTPVHDAVMARNPAFSALKVRRDVPRLARLLYRHPALDNRHYARAKDRVLRAVFEINRRPLRIGARAFDGLM